ncbi:4Fe-4S dicluster domain-containing protein [Nocardioides marmoriginsengisoli]|uniref:4Fe-4S dicluster domain-containing protein n=1 Tax=Nocardioides marmoriginsengisoli TaxID=661483 RepID=A0A3N0CB06_9ACTN|nr:heterodisulfide reductase-related iron-sulfur binding cluster [Nocardioides marmoriginsengisoli]RNL60489.1 4Fe-4S dicluster domain-containing protein [Nocardioides marmoriginsengisoli]
MDTKLTLILGLILNIVILPLALKRVIFLVRLITGGKPAPDRIVGVTSRVSKALKNQLVEVLGQKKLLKWSIPGIAHSFVMYAFLILGTVYVEAYGILLSTNAHWKIPLVGDWWILGFAQDLIGVLCLVGLLTFAIIRYKNQPAKLGRKSRFKGSHTGGAWVVLIMIFNVIWTMFLFRGAAAAADNLPYSSSSAFFSHAIGNVINSMGLHHGDNGLEILEGVGLLLHIGIMLVFLIIVLNSKHLHIFVAPINIMFKRPDGPVALGAVKEMISDGKAITLDDVEDLDEETVLGIGSIEDFSWKGLLDMASCTECGRCQSQCPAWNTEKPLSPKMLIMNARDHAFAKAPFLMTPEDKRSELPAEVLAEAERPLVGVSEGEYAWHPEGGAIIDNDVLWSCTNCGACVNQCPVDIEHVDHIIDMRRYQVLVEANFPAELNGLFKGLENKGNPWNMNPNARMEWAQGLDFDVKVVGEDVQDLTEVDWLFWVGCAGAYEDRAKKTTRAVAELLDMAGVSFAVLGNGETCTGDSARRAGNEFVFQALAQQNIETFNEHKVKKVVSTCAHCFNTLKNEYKQFGIELEVVHHTQLLNRLVREKKLTPVAAPGPTRKITYHDPCFLGRHNQVYSPPRELLQVIPGSEVVEMPRSAERSFCCGAGGARMWMEETIGERINVNRTAEAVETGADQIAVGCPFCRTMLEDGLTSEQDAGRAGENVEVLDVAQLLLASVKGEGKKEKAPAAKKAPAAPAAPAEPAEAPAAAPAAGGSLFDSAPAAPAAPAAGGSLFDTPAEPAAPASGGSLFDTPAPAAPAAGGSLFDTPAPAAPDVEPVETPAPKAETAPKADLGSGGSLFDVAPTEAAPNVEPVETPAPKAAAAPQADLGSGSLFDIAPAEPATTPVAEPAAEAEEPEAEPEPEEKPAPPASSGEAHQPKTDTKIPEGGSLFDL